MSAKTTGLLPCLAPGFVLIALLCGNAAATEEPGAGIDLNDIKSLAQAFGRIKRDYVDEVKEDKLLDAAVVGMMSTLDEHSRFLPAEDFTDLDDSNHGRYVGIGLEVQVYDGLVRVAAAIPGSPAQKAGFRSGDVLTELDGKSVYGMTLAAILDNMRGDEGSIVRVQYRPAGENHLKTVRLARAYVRLTSTSSDVYLNRFAYLRISSFQTDTALSLNAALNDLQIGLKESPLRGVVLDLRNNPGGVLYAAVAVVDTFLSQGLIVYTEGRNADSQLSFNATSGDAINGLPMVILINGESASAAEIVAGALQDHGRALIVGSTSYGKGSVQTILPLSNGSALKLTTARYYTPSGRSIEKKGIIPDVEVSDEPNQDATPDDSEAELSQLKRTDRALYQAIKLLRFSAGLAGPTSG